MNGGRNTSVLSVGLIYRSDLSWSLEFMNMVVSRKFADLCEYM